MQSTFRLSAVAAALLSITLIAGCQTASQAPSPHAAQSVVQQAPLTLETGNWDTFNRAQLDKMIATHGKTSPGYDANKPPYVVFDWDNTSIFLDIEEALLIHQLQNLRFAMTPAQLDKAIRKDIPTTDFDADSRNDAGQAINIDKIAQDIVSSYTWLYDNYQGFQGRQPLAQIRQSPQYQDFIVKMRFLYEAIGNTFDHAVSYPWITYHFTGMTEQDVRALAAETFRWQQTQPVEAVKWTSPAALPGKAGVVSISWKNGLRPVPEMQDLYQKLRASGFDVYVCSASFRDVIREVSSNPEFGYANAVDNVYAMELERDARGVIQTQFRKGYAQTQGPGKTETIKQFLVPRYGYGPLFIAGDSEGDQNMMQDFADTRYVLIINRLRGNDIGKMSKLAVDSYGKPDAKYLLQGRDDNKGVLIPSQQAYKLGSTTASTLK
ncbi:haloacid dehalogenase-like hydrolase [Pseudothauera nasutitermitis]|uniref:phosphoserine phosphatase n=1 Tax=Pseudothauera nasutitermitis TaxID=2565930 RepID=A0A4S4B409_9RHOO|nr:haloacid dehalogenase-like hydrolase [Pseudothauera nasutitermitis]THF67011.1 haloacid dehalogenase-like hydrolase [Pseudothauera nasutitermitis]